MNNKINQVFGDQKKLVDFFESKNIYYIYDLTKELLFDFFSFHNIDTKTKFVILKKYNEAKHEMLKFTNTKDRLTEKVEENMKVLTPSEDSIGVLINDNSLKKRLQEDLFYITTNIITNAYEILYILHDYSMKVENVYFTRFYYYLRERLYVGEINKTKLRQFLTKYISINGENIRIKNVEHKIIFEDLINKNTTIKRNQAGNSNSFYNKIFMFFVNTEKIFGSEISREIINKGVSKFNSYLSLYKSSENSNFGINIRLIDMIIIELYEQYTNYVSSENSIKTEDASQLWIDNYSNNFALNINDKSLKYLKLLNLFMRLPVENNVINLGLLADKKLRHIFLQHNIVSLEDLKNVFDKGLYLEIFELYDELVEVLNFLSENLFEKVRESFKKILNVKVVANNLQIIKDRQKGYTLEQIGKIYGVTRERIRQRETRAIKTICKLLNNSIYLNNRKIMCAVANNYYYISLDKLEEIFREDYDVLLLAISKPGCLSEFKYIEELSIIDISENNIFSDILDDLSKLPELFTKDELSTIISNLKNDYEDIINLDELIYGFIEKKYSVSGELIHKNKVSYREKYKVIMEKYFNDGININSEEEIELFKLYYKKEFESDDIDDKSIRSIQGVLAYICVIVGRGKYNLKEKIKSIPLDLLKKIEDYITDKKLIMYNELYKIFQLELESNNVNSPRELHGILKVQSKNKFNFTKDYITIDQFKNSTKEIIEEYAQNYKRISMVQLKKAFPNLNESVLYNNMLSNEKFIALQNKEWYVFNREDYFKEDIEKLDKLIQALIKEYEIVNSRHIYDSTIVMYPDIIEKYHIVNRHQLFGIVKNIFNDKYQFKVSKVAKHGVEINNSIERVKEFIYSYNEIAIYDIRDFIEDNYLNIYSFYDQIILEIINDYIWLDKDKFIKLENIDVQEKVIDEIENYFTYLLSFRKQIIVDDSFDFTFMPKIKYKWNKYLLFSVIYSQSKKLKILSTTNNYLTTDFLVVKNGSDITSNNE